jgi:protein-S-isoprenylcysteine O-methyltransferase Ste14
MSKVMMAIAIVAILAYLALAVLGEGSLAAFLSHPALIAVAMTTIVLAVASFFTDANLSSGEREDRGNRWVLLVFSIIGLADGFVPAYCDRIGFWTVDGETIRWWGAALYVIGGALRLAPVFVLGSRFSGLAAIQKGHTLVTTGIFGVVRNPSYLGMLLLMLGWGLAFRSWVGVLIAALALVPLVGRIRSEEALLRSQFGSEYDSYCARTWRLVPGIY